MTVMPVVPMPAVMAMPTVMAVPAAMVVPTPMPVPAHFGGNIFRILLNGRRSARIAERQRLSLLSGSSDHEQSSNHRKTQNFRSLHPQFSFTSCISRRPRAAARQHPLRATRRDAREAEVNGA